MPSPGTDATQDLAADRTADTGSDTGSDAAPSLDAADANADRGTTVSDGGGTDARPAMITASATTMDFTKVEIGVQSPTQTWTITNGGDSSTGPLALANGNSTELIVTNNCTAALAAGAQCTIVVAVKASAGGARSGMLTLTGASGGTVTLAVSATAGYRLTVTKVGTGTVTSVPAGVSCGATCSAILDAGTAVTLQARTTNGSDSFFSGWSGGGGCTGPLRDCAFTLSASVNATATFSPMTNNLIFVSSGTFPTTRGSAAAYDNDCNIAATAAGINDAAGGSYIAFTADAATTVPARLGMNARGWVRMDGKPFADSQMTLFNSNQVFNSIRFSEVGQAVGRATTLMTGVSTAGTASNNCVNWTTTSDAVLCGDPEGGPGRWTDIGATCHAGCNGGPYRIICMGKSKTATLTPTPVAGRLIWLDSTVFFTPGMTGVFAVPDQVCQSEAPAGVTTAVALLAYTNAAAKGPATILAPSMNYVRPDGILVGTGAQLIAAGPLSSGIWQAASGTYRTGGGPAGMAVTGGAGGSAANTCTDWSGASTGVLGDYGRTDSTWWTFGALNACMSVPLWFYCVQTAP